jgi:hypothetical protein
VSAAGATIQSVWEDTASARHVDKVFANEMAADIFPALGRQKSRPTEKRPSQWLMSRDPGSKHGKMAGLALEEAPFFAIFPAWFSWS